MADLRSVHGACFAVARVVVELSACSVTTLTANFDADEQIGNREFAVNNQRSYLLLCDALCCVGASDLVRNRSFGPNLVDHRPPENLGALGICDAVDLCDKLQQAFGIWINVIVCAVYV